MTKEEIVIPLWEKHISDKYDMSMKYGKNDVPAWVLESMEEYKDQELSILTERYNDLALHFECLLTQYCPDTSKYKQKMVEAGLWDIKAGLKEQ